MTERPRGTVRLKDCFSDTVVSTTGAAGNCALTSSDFYYNMESCHMQRFSDDTAVVGCIGNGHEDECRNLVDVFVQWR